uniref:Palmitoyl-protein hydrolase n=1 Tax=Rhabditophanes sp. KR3021 TaxID=114890 RepID=A0AC35TLU4_9BILA
MCFKKIVRPLLRRIPSTVSTNSRTLVDNRHSMIQGSDPVVVAPVGKHTSSLIFFHGLGDQGHSWADAFRHSIKLPNTNVICPNSADRPVTLNMGMRMPAWFDLLGLTPESGEDGPGILEAAKYVHTLIDNEIAKGIAPERIVVAGFSMGGALALYAGLVYPKPLAGVVGLSTFLCQRAAIPQNVVANKSVPVFLGHGTNDFLLPHAIGKMTETHLKAFNPNVEFHSYPGMEHSSCQQELADVVVFLKKVIP